MSVVKEYPGFNLSVKDKLAVITFARPEKKNAFNRAVYEGLTEVLNEISARDDITITALTGQGDFYTSGNDLSDILTRTGSNPQAIANSALHAVRDLVAALIDHKKVLVAVVNGPAVGIGVTMLPLCDIVYCTPKAWFTTPFTQLGICAEAASSYTFPILLGSSKANEMLLFSEKLTAEDAFKHGFVSKIIPHDKLQEQVWDVLQNNAQNLGPKSLQASKGLIRRWNSDLLHAANRVEIEKLKELFVSDEAIEAVLRFSSRRRSKL